MIKINLVTKYYTELVKSLILNTSITRIVLDGETFTPKSADYPFIRITTMPREPTQREVGHKGIISYPGLMRIDLYYSRALNSSTEQSNLADELVNLILLNRSIVIDSNQLITEGAWMEQLRNLDGNTNLPIFVRWINYATNS